MAWQLVAAAAASGAPGAGWVGAGAVAGRRAAGQESGLPHLVGGGGTQSRVEREAGRRGHLRLASRQNYYYSISTPRVSVGPCSLAGLGLAALGSSRSACLS